MSDDGSAVSAVDDDALAERALNNNVLDESEGTTTPRPSRRLPTWALILIGGAVGALIGLAAAIATRGDSKPSTLSLAPTDTGVPAEQQSNARAFLAAWQRYRQATFVTELTLDRRLNDGQTLSTTRIMVQQPPRRVVRQLNSVSTLGDAGEVSCDKVEDQTVCTPGNGQTYDASVQSELVAWATAFAGSAPAYFIDVAEPGCYELNLARALAAPPYGAFARFCFDDATGALRARQVVRETGTDTEQATRISVTITDADWAKAAG